jgi:hypothetical protein
MGHYYIMLQATSAMFRQPTIKTDHALTGSPLYDVTDKIRVNYLIVYISPIEDKASISFKGVNRLNEIARKTPGVADGKARHRFALRHPLLRCDVHRLLIAFLAGAVFAGTAASLWFNRQRFTAIGKLEAELERAVGAIPGG